MFEINLSSDLVHDSDIVKPSYSAFDKKINLRHKNLFLWFRTFSNNQLSCNFFTHLASGGIFKYALTWTSLLGTGACDCDCTFLLFIHSTLTPALTRTLLVGMGGFSRVAGTFLWFVLASSIIFFRVVVVVIFIKTIPFRCDAEMKLTFFAK